PALLTHGNFISSIGFPFYVAFISFLFSVNHWFGSNGNSYRNWQATGVLFMFRFFLSYGYAFGYQDLMSSQDPLGISLSVTLLWAVFSFIHEFIYNIWADGDFLLASTTSPQLAMADGAPLPLKVFNELRPHEGTPFPTSLVSLPAPNGPTLKVDVND